MFDIDDRLIYHPNIILTSNVYDILDNMHKYLRNWTFNFRKIWGEVVDFILAFFQSIWECSSENIIKIGPYLPKLLQEKFGTVFLAHPVYKRTLFDLYVLSVVTGVCGKFWQRWR